MRLVNMKAGGKHMYERLPPALLYAQHGHALMGESPECALMTGSI